MKKISKRILTVFLVTLLTLAMAMPASAAPMVEVAIKAVEAVFDWKDYLKREFDWVDPEENNGEEHADI